MDEGQSPVNCIVSVVMLREGWDVQSVTVIVGLRPYTAKANILPEQTVGRGLRLMFRDQGAGYVERVDVIGNKKFIEFVEQLEREEDIQLDTFELGKDKVVIVTIAPDPAKLDRDITLPVLSPILSRKKTLAEEIAALDVASFPCPVLPRKETDARRPGVPLRGLRPAHAAKDLGARLHHPRPADGRGGHRLLRPAHCPGSQAAVPVRRAGPQGARVPGNQGVRRPRSAWKARRWSRRSAATSPSTSRSETFVQALRDVLVEELEPQLLNPGRRLSETPVFPWSRPTLKAAKCVFNLVPCDNKFEEAFARFLESSDDVVRFAKLPDQFGFSIEYTDAATNLRYYEPDFVAITEDGTHHLIETKGMEDLNVAHKDNAAQLWCDNATRLTGNPWVYVKVRQNDYESLQPSLFADLNVLRPR